MLVSVHRRPGLLAAALAVLALAGCGDGDGKRVRPETDPGAGDPGTPIADTFVVAAGSYLLGRSFPDVEAFEVVDGEAGEPDGWVAYLDVTGDPVTVLGSYLDQARVKGYAVVISADADDPAAPLCTDVEVAEEDVALSEGVHCRATLLTSAGDRLLELSLWRSPDRAGTLLVTSRPADATDDLVPDPDPQVAAPDLSPLADVTRPTVDSEGFPSSVTLVGTVAVDDGEGGEAFQAVLLLGSDPIEAMEDLRADSIDDLSTDVADTDASKVVEQQIDGATLLAYDVNNPAVGFEQALTVVPDDGGPAYALTYSEDAG